MRDTRRFAWLDRIDSGQTSRSLAADNGVSQRTIQLAVAEARAEVSAWVETQRLLWPPRLMLFFPYNGLFPGTLCRCDVAPIPRNTTLCCAVCHKSGKDNHPALQRYPHYEPRPDPSTKQAKPHATRKERRARTAHAPDQPGRARGVSAA